MATAEQVARFFETNPAPENIDKYEEQVTAFVAESLQKGRKIAVVTSGGTTVPLEKRTVRFLDNFSGGKRGSASAEFFLEKGYAVVFLHRRFSLQPFSRRFVINTATSNFLDFLVPGEQDDAVQVVPQWSAPVRTVLALHDQTKAEGTLLKLPFTTVTDYLWLLRAVARKVAVAEAQALFYCAAAVSDFYLSPDNTVEHKIQSSNGSLSLTLEPVPKMLTALIDEWSPRSYIVSFKLETDENILEPKAHKALQTYKHQLVIGNLLATHKDQVILYQPEKSPIVLERSEEDIAKDIDIEASLVAVLSQLHSDFISERQQQ